MNFEREVMSNQVDTVPEKVITRRMWSVMAALALTGQIAWGVENMWFNAFVYDKITPDPRPIAWMVAVSAITATLTTLIMGTLSDRTRTRFGRRKPFILFGYILWGISTIVFPTVAYIKSTSLAVIGVVLADALMTFFGSTANDSSFNAWTTDIASSPTRGRVEGVLQVSTYLAQVVVMVAAGLVIDQIGYFYFFYLLGAIVMIVGVIAGGLLPEPPLPMDEKPHQPFWSEFTELFQLKTITENKVLFLLLIFIMVSSIGNQVSMPYLIVYLKNYLGMSNQQFSIVGGAVMVGGALVAIPFGILADRMNRRTMIIVTVIASATGEIILSTMHGLIPLAITAFIWQGFLVAYGIASGAWMKDLLPEESRGKFLGVRMIFWIALPMVIGPFIGSTLISHFGIPTVSNGQAGFIPIPLIFQVDAAIALASLLVMLRIDKKDALPASMRKS
jgi:MFS family permease